MLGWTHGAYEKATGENGVGPFNADHDIYSATASYELKDGISVDGDSFKVLSMRDPAQLPWKDLGVDVVFESTGLFTNRPEAAKHVTAGAKRVANGSNRGVAGRALRSRRHRCPGGSFQASRKNVPGDGMNRYTRNSSTASGRGVSSTRPQRRAAASSLANHHCPFDRPT